ncbi:uncharacterized protein EAF02_010672 [Botrytis sinoallii]|nr:uncharacterized protein EAE97_004628 [Botrytis byssoidea]XP_038753590.1 uncharacterized protein EAF02_010672 [Botrytis sinoallii]XP_038807587.1 uncharacterized protein EAE98_008505 [Botrytis deweyae]KAF7882198.1 hypothetical protein EAF00_011714 [Botryotinia globosa]KAF7917752.1 hypothetical protein EAE99_009128 [Botrytis elliptica]KAF7861718.1 hypothetical protein EAF02_010672 [Botrytis sinoallii]KAF7921658.1 hypothetical protein EAE98_008505 [Botrytis deweyae]KAF7945590.1 hypothetical p
MAMRIAPSASHTSTHTHLQEASLGAPSAPGLHDTLRHGVGPTQSSSLSTLPDSSHPLENRLKKWESTQESLKMASLRRTFGMSEPIRRGMELKITREGEWRPLALGGGGPGLHEEILRGSDTTISWEDVFKGDETRTLPGFHEEVERKVKMGF